MRIERSFKVVMGPRTRYGENNGTSEGDKSVEPPSMDKYCLVLRVVILTGVRIAGLSN